MTKKDDSLKTEKKDSFLKEILSFYNENLRKKHIILYIICLLVFFVIMTIYLNNSNIEQEIKNNMAVVNTESQSSIKNILDAILVEKLPLTALITFAGITPFVFIPVLGVLNSYIFAVRIVRAFYISNVNPTILAIGCVIQLFGYALAIATGIYYCSLSSKKFRYRQGNSYSFSDIKKKFYTITQNKKKLNEINKKMKQKIKNNEKLNVKVPYKMLVIVTVISFLIVTIGTLISQGV